jgi:hypothetical protein
MYILFFRIEKNQRYGKYRRKEMYRGRRRRRMKRKRV